MNIQQKEAFRDYTIAGRSEGKNILFLHGGILMNKKFLEKACLIYCIVFFTVFCSCQAVLADDSMFDINSLGVTKGVIVENRMDSYVTREEMAQIIVNLISQNDTAISMEEADFFDDIANSRYKGAINALYSLNIVSGVEERIFQPERNIRYTEACKLFVDILGYNKIIKNKDLESYKYFAGTIGITKKIYSQQEYLTFENLVIMIDNVLDIGKMSAQVNSNGDVVSYTVDENDTFRNELTMSNVHKNVKMRGIVTADVSSYLITQRDDITPNQLEINGELFEYDGVAPLGLIGMEIEMYVSETSSGIDKIISIATTKRNNVLEIYGDDVVKFDRSKLSYYENDKRIKNISLNTSTKYIYNNHIERNFSPDMLNYNNTVTIRTVDNNNDKIADVVVIFEYENHIVEKVYIESEVITLKKEYRGNKSLLLGESDTDAYVEYYDEEGNRVDISAIKEDSVVSVATSLDGFSVRIVVCNKRIKGYVELQSDDSIVIDGIEYAYKSDFTGLKPGINVEIWVNFCKTVIDYEKIVASTDYAFVYTTEVGRGVSRKKGLVKLILPGPVETKTVEGEFDEQNNNTAVATNLYLNNSYVMVYTLAERVKVDGKIYKSADVLPIIDKQAISYTINDNDEIKEIEIAKHENGIRQRMYYNSSEKIFGTGMATPFGIDDKTVAICLPVTRNGNDVTIEMLSDTELENFKMELMNANNFFICGYDVDEETHIAPLIVVEQDASSMNVGNYGSLIADKKRVGMVTKNIHKYDESADDYIIQIDMLTYGTQQNASNQTFRVSDLLSNQTRFENVSKGDLVLYSIDNFGYINNIEILQSFENYNSDFINREGTDFETWCYSVHDIDLNEIQNQRRRWVDVLELSSSGAPDTVIKSFDLLKNEVLSPIVYIIYDKDDIRLGTTEEIHFGDKVLVYNPKSVGDVTAICVKR